MRGTDGALRPLPDVQAIVCPAVTTAQDSFLERLQGTMMIVGTCFPKK